MASATSITAPEARPSRRAVFSAAFVAAIPTAALADAGDLMALHRRYEAVSRAYNAAGPRDEDGEQLFAELEQIEHTIAAAPCWTSSDAQAKVFQVMRGLKAGERGTEFEALQQVVAWLQAN